MKCDLFFSECRFKIKPSSVVIPYSKQKYQTQKRKNYLCQELADPFVTSCARIPSVIRAQPLRNLRTTAHLQSVVGIGTHKGQTYTQIQISETHSIYRDVFWQDIDIPEKNSTYIFSIRTGLFSFQLVITKLFTLNLIQDCSYKRRYYNTYHVSHNRDTIHNFIMIMGTLTKQEVQ